MRRFACTARAVLLIADCRFQLQKRRVVRDVEFLWRDVCEHLHMLLLPAFQVGIWKRCANSAAGFHPPVPAFSGKPNAQREFLPIGYLEVLAIAFRQLDWMHYLAGAAPIGIELEGKTLACSRNLVFERQPCHIQKQQPPVRLEDVSEKRSCPFVVEVAEALAGRHNVERAFGKAHVLGRRHVVFDVHPG